MVRNNVLVAALAASAAATTAPAPSEQIRIVEVSPGVTQYVTRSERDQLAASHKHFIDITNHPNLSSAASTYAKKVVQYPEGVQFESEVKALIGLLDKSIVESNLQTYSDYETRYYETETGIAAAKWLLEQVQKVIADSGVEGASAEAYTHPEWEQISIIAKIPGKNEKKIVAGAHLDSINGNDELGRSPGADDNGSGSMTLLESMRVLLTAAEIGELENSLEFHWYAAEEVGLLGSADIMDEYAAAGADVAAYLNQDMTGWAPPGEVGEIGMITDFTDSTLNDYIYGLASVYVDIPVVNSTCGYACSDHASASAAGYPASFFFEAAADNTSPYIHTADDAMDTVSFDHIIEHCKLVTGYMYELGFATLASNATRHAF